MRGPTLLTLGLGFGLGALSGWAVHLLFTYWWGPSTKQTRVERGLTLTLILVLFVFWILYFTVR